MDQLQQLNAAAASLLEKAQNGSVAELASAVEKATGVLKLASDLEKSRAELRKLALEENKLQYENNTASKRERSERLKEYVSLMTPIVTIVTLAATLVWQSWQFVQSEKDKREAAEDAQWADAVKMISQASKLNPGVVALSPFLKSTKYRDSARDTAVQLLANSTDNIFFDDLFGATFVPATWSNFPYLMKLDRAIRTRAEPVWNKAWDEKAQSSDRQKLDDPQEKAIFDYVDYAQSKLSAQVGALLKTPRPDQSGLDLSATSFRGCNWEDVNLEGAKIEGMSLQYADVKGANLNKITQFEGLILYRTAWWEAEHIEPELLTHLEKNEKYDPDAGYGPRQSKVPRAQYNAALARLRRQP
jgi:uncharacterized protein YjbI with pentapeptide repeats